MQTIGGDADAIVATQFTYKLQGLQSGLHKCRSVKSTAFAESQSRTFISYVVRDLDNPVEFALVDN